MQMADALMAAEPTRRSNVPGHAVGLGTDDAIAPHLPEGYDGSLRLADAVTSDWKGSSCWFLGSIDGPLANLVSVLTSFVAPSMLLPANGNWVREWRIVITIQMVRDIGVEVVPDELGGDKRR